MRPTTLCSAKQNGRLHGHRPFQDEPDSRPLPEERQVRAALADGSVRTRATEVETSNFRSRAGPEACAPAQCREPTRRRCRRQRCVGRLPNVPANQRPKRHVPKRAHADNRGPFSLCSRCLRWKATSRLHVASAAGWSGLHAASFLQYLQGACPHLRPQTRSISISCCRAETRVGPKADPHRDGIIRPYMRPVEPNAP